MRKSYEDEKARVRALTAVLTEGVDQWRDGSLERFSLELRQVHADCVEAAVEAVDGSSKLSESATRHLLDRFRKDARVLASQMGEQFLRDEVDNLLKKETLCD